MFMKIKDFRDLKIKKIEDLRKLLGAKQLENLKARAKIVSGGQSNLKEGKNLRRDIARISTLVREKEIMEELQVKGKENA